VQLGGLPVQTDVSAGRWIADAVHGRLGTVAGTVPAVFEAYARVLHPAARYVGDDDVDVTWAEVAAHNGTVAHPLAQWPSVTGAWEYLTSDSQPPVWDGPPSDGHLPVQVARVLAARLAGHTTTPDRCWFGRWDGHGFDGAVLHHGIPRLLLHPDRAVVLVLGTVADAVRNLAPEPFEQSAHLWWPDDRAWCVATDIDDMSTFIGGSATCIGELLAAPDLETHPVDPGDAVGWGDDPVNPVPDRD
jgi:hypothetical protein